MSRKLDLTGKRFGRLLVVSEAKKAGKNRQLVCVCDCGRPTICQMGNLTTGRSQSCGCLRIAQLVAANVVRKTTHGASRSPLYRLWSGMVNRCRNPRSKDFFKYGGRGIVVCSRWEDFAAFREDMGLRPTAMHSVERIDNNVGYCPENCEWALPRDQAQNRRGNVLMEHLGMTKTLAAWADFVGIARPTIYWRYKQGDRGAHLLRPPK